VPQIYTAEYQPEIGKGIVLMDGGDVTIMACGVLVARAIEAVRLLAREGVAARLVEIHTIKPLDEELVRRCARETGAVVTVEEHSIVAGWAAPSPSTFRRCAPCP